MHRGVLLCSIGERTIEKVKKETNKVEEQEVGITRRFRSRDRCDPARKMFLRAISQSSRVKRNIYIFSLSLYIYISELRGFVIRGWLLQRTVVRCSSPPVMASYKQVIDVEKVRRFVDDPGQRKRYYTMREEARENSSNSTSSCPNDVYQQTLQHCVHFFFSFNDSLRTR